MKEAKSIKLLILSLLVIPLLCPFIAYSYGLKTGFGKVILEQVPLGARYSMREHAQFPLVITNESEKEVKLELEVLVPQEGEIQEGYEPIPSTDWVKLEKTSFLVNPGGEAETDVVLSVPDDEIYAGRKFHVFIWSRTVEERLGVGIKSKLLFSVKE